MTRTELLAEAKPILFNTEMVRAILDGRKTVTRRAIKPRYRDDEIGFNVVTNAHDGLFVRIEKYDEYESTFDEKGRERIVNPPYNAGDILYVRETWTHCNIVSSDNYLFKADYDTSMKPYCNWGWHPSIHMPKEAARMFLKITRVRAERLQDITAKGAISEGEIPIIHTGGSIDERATRTSFIGTWNSTIPKKNRELYGWNANPWVWVVEFEKINITE